MAALLSGGRLTAIPRKPAREQLLEHPAHAFFERDRVCTEREADGALLAAHEDCSALLPSRGHRPRGGGSYRRGRWPTVPVPCEERGRAGARRRPGPVRSFRGLGGPARVS